MIGGTDICVAMSPSPGTGDVRFFMSLIRHLWPEAVVETIGGSQASVVPISSIFPIHSAKEILIYRDQGSFESWRDEGATDDNGGALVHLIVDEKQMTFVVDEESSPTGRMVGELIVALQRNRRSQEKWWTPEEKAA